MNPAVSIIVPSFNHRKFLEKRMESIFAQTCQDFEVILLDDASTDGSGEWLQGISRHPKVTALDINKTNSGSPFRQWARGLEKASGEFIWIAESDDWAHPELLERSLEVLQNHPGVGMVNHASHLVNQEGDIVGSTNYRFHLAPTAEWDGMSRYDGKTFLKMFMLHRSGVYNASGVVFRKKACEGFDDYVRLKQAGDTLFWTNILTRYDIVVGQEPLNGFRQHEGSVTAGNYGRRDLVPMREMYHRIAFARQAIPIEQKELQRVYADAYDRTQKEMKRLGVRPGTTAWWRIMVVVMLADRRLLLRKLAHQRKKRAKQLACHLHRPLMKVRMAKAFRKLGFELIAHEDIDPAQSTATREPGVPVDPAELHALDQALVAFSQTDAAGKLTRAHEPGGVVDWGDPATARNYLQDWRIALFHEVIAVLEQGKVTIDNEHVLELGSGSGYLLRLLSQSFAPASLTGYDQYKELNTLARFLCPTAEIVERDLFAPYDRHYALIVCMETLEHLKRPEDAVVHMHRHVQPGGHLLLTVPNGRHDRFPALEPFPDGEGYWGHIHFWSPESWRLFLENALGAATNMLTGELNKGQILFALIPSPHPKPPQKPPL